MADKKKLKAYIAQARAERYADGGEVSNENLPQTADSTVQDTVTNDPGVPQGAAASQLPAIPQATTPKPINVLNPNGELVSLPHEQLDDALNSGYSMPSSEQIEQHFGAQEEQKYGTTEQQFKAGLEGLAQGVAGPLAVQAEIGMGVRPEDIRGREAANPWTHGLAQTAGMVGSAAVGVGEGAILEGAGQAVRGLMGVGKGTFLSQLGPEAVKAAFEGVLFGGSEEASKVFKQDPEQSAGSAMIDIGLSGVLGGVFGGPIGALLNKAKVEEQLAKTVKPSSFVSEVDRPAMEAGDFATSVKHSDAVTPTEKSEILGGLLDRSEKAEAPAIRAAAKRLDAPVLEGMVSANKHVQKGEDALINGAPTYSGIRRAKLYNAAYDKAGAAVEQALGDPSRYTKAELGSIFRDSLTAQIKEENAPIAEAYKKLKQSHDVIPVDVAAGPEIAKELSKIPEVRVTSTSPEAKLVRDVLSDLENVRTVDDLKVVKTSVTGRLKPDATSKERHIASILRDRFKTLEENSIEAFAKKSATTPEEMEAALGLKAARKAADAQYKPFIEKVQRLAEMTGKRKIYGPSDAINFITEKVTPEELVQRLGNTRDSEARHFFEKEFPEQHALMQEYQKGLLRAQASKTGDLSHKVLFNSINKLEPEIQKSIFNPVELQKLKDAETYIRSFPKNFNPSGTSGMSAFRELFSHPMMGAAANARDFAIEKFVKNVPKSPEIDNAISLAQSTIKGEKLTSRAIKSLFDRSSEMPMGVLPTLASRTKLDKMITMYAANPDKLLNSGDNNPVPEYAQAFSAASARAIQYLNSVRPNTDNQAPFDSKRKPSPAEQASYDRALDIAQNPLSIVDKMRQGTMTTQDINTLKAIHPGVYKSLQEKMMASVMDQSTKGKTIPYATRLQLSQFLGQPLDSTMTPKSILSAQAKPIQQSQQPPPQSSTAKLSGIPKSSMTSSQKRESVRAGQQKD